MSPHYEKSKNHDRTAQKDTVAEGGSRSRPSASLSARWLRRIVALAVCSWCLTFRRIRQLMAAETAREGDAAHARAPPPPRHQTHPRRDPPFNPFADLRFGPPRVLDATAGARRDFPSSSHHCVGTGSEDTLEYQADGDDDAGAMELRRPKFFGRSCRYRNLYYRPADQTFHYFPSDAARRATRLGAALGPNEGRSNSTSDMQVSLNSVSMNNNSPQRLKQLTLLDDRWSPIVHDNDDGIPPPRRCPQSRRKFRQWRRERPEAPCSYRPTDDRNRSAATFAVVEPAANDDRRLIFELFRPRHSFNFGHLLWDDFASLFSLLHLFGIGDYHRVRAVPFFVERRSGDPLYQCSPHNMAKWNQCVRMYRKFYPLLLGIQTDCSGDILRTGNWLRGNHSIGKWPHAPQRDCSAAHANDLAPLGADYVLLPEVLAGTGATGKAACQEECGIGTGPARWELQRFFLVHLFGDLRARRMRQEPPRGYVTFALPVGSSRPGEQHWFEEEIRRARARYGNDTVKAVDVATLSMADQASLAHDSAVYLTNHGGGSATTIFLQRGASAFLFWQGRKRDHGLYESTEYFQTIWVGSNERQYVDRTMALIEREVEKVAQRWPGILAAVVTHQ